MSACLHSDLPTQPLSQGWVFFCPAHARVARVKVGVYVDAFNLYYGMRDNCGRGTAGWRWLDIRALATGLAQWQGSTIERIVYCTAYVDAIESQAAHADQSVYIKALRAHGSIDVLQLGTYVAWPKKLPLANELPSGKAEVIVPTGTETWHGLPITTHTEGLSSPNPHGDMFLATVRNREEKGSDVNVATHLLADIFWGDINAAIVVSNDSDLALPLSVARTFVPVGTVNPGTKPLAGALKGGKNDGPGGHWWRRLSDQDYYMNQMPNPVDQYYKPADW